MTLKSLALPGGVLLLGVVVLVQAGWLTLAMPALSFLYYCGLVGGLLLAWRFNSSRVFFALLCIGLAQQAVAWFNAGWPGAGHAVFGTPGWIVLRAAAVLIPLDFVVIGFMQERGFAISAIAPISLFLFVQSVAVLVLARAGELQPTRAHHAVTVTLPDYAWFALAAGGIVLLLRTLFVRKPADSALFWSLISFFLSIWFATTARASSAYAATAACILAVSIIENSYLLAYHDELTSLPSRRAFNDALLRLNSPFCIAVADIDHFKRFNDTYGHETGDQVLRLVAAQLARVTAGGQAFRCGGEEFTILFPGKTISEVIEPLEQLRASIASADFHLRGGDRRQTLRGPDRRHGRARSRTGHAIRRLAHQQPAALSVTISIGVAASAAEKPQLDRVLDAADKALYRAKANGRNRVESATPARRRVKAADIA